MKKLLVVLLVIVTVLCGCGKDGLKLTDKHIEILEYTIKDESNNYADLFMVLRKAWW